MSEGLKGTSATPVRPLVPRAMFPSEAKRERQIPGRDKAFLLQTPEEKCEWSGGAGSSDVAQENRLTFSQKLKVN